jgi:hypothetical protein
MLARLIYASAVTAPLGPDAMTRLLAQAWLHNGLHGLTGLLVFDSSHFLQVIEGAPRALNDLYGQLLKDPRHRDLLLLKYGRVAERRFPDWSMGFMPADAAHAELIGRHAGGGRRFDPLALDGEQAESLLFALAAAGTARPGSLLTA